MKKQEEIQRLVKRCQHGEREAQYELYRQFADAMLNTCYRLMNNREDAEDMMQEGFISAFRRLATFDGRSSLGTWLKRIMINRCLDQLRQRRVELFPMKDNMDWEEAYPWEEASEMPSVDAIYLAMQNLPDGLRIVFSLFYLEGYDHQEISQILGVSTSGTKSQLSKARSRIREIIGSNSIIKKIGNG